jgi:hypothetical protein
MDVKKSIAGHSGGPLLVSVGSIPHADGKPPCDFGTTAYLIDAVTADRNSCDGRRKNQWFCRPSCDYLSA